MIKKMDVRLTCSRDCRHYEFRTHRLGNCSYSEDKFVTPFSECIYHLTIDAQDRLTTSEERKRGKQRARGGPVDGQAGEAD